MLSDTNYNQNIGMLLKNDKICRKKNQRRSQYLKFCKLRITFENFHVIY